MRKKTGSIQPRGDSWRISYYDVNHIRQYETHPNEEAAQRELAKRLAEVASGIPVSSKPNTVKFGELCKDVVVDYQVRKLRSVDDIETRFRLHIEPVFGQRKAVQITTSQLKQYILMRQGQDASSGTINRELEAIKRAFLLAHREGKLLIRGPHVPILQETNIRKGFFTREEVERLCRFLKSPIDALVMFGFLTGWRLEEIRGLRWSQVDFVAGEIRLDPGTTKSGEARVFPMTDELRALLDSLTPTTAAARRSHARAASRHPVISKIVATPGAGFVFSIGAKPLGAFRKTWKTACYKAGLPCVVEPVRKGGKQGAVKIIKCLRIFHDLRRSAAREMENQGVPRGVIMELMGHHTSSMFERYRIVSEADKKRAAEILNGARNGAKKTGGTTGTQ